MSEQAKKTIYSGILAAVVLLAGCSQTAVSQRSSPAPISVDVPVATVNSHPIRQSQLLDILIPAYGKKVLDELILWEIVRQKASQRGIHSTEQDRQKEYSRILQQIAPGKSRREQEAMFSYMLESRKLSRREFDIIIERQSLLRKLVNQDVTITDKQIAEEYRQEYARKLQIQQIIVSSYRTIQKVYALLSAGESFDKLVEIYSEDQPSLLRKGMVGPFTESDRSIPQAIRKEANKLQHVGDHSNIFRYYDEKNVEWWCLIKLIKIIPAGKVSLEEVKPELVSRLKNRIINQRMLNLLKKWKREASISILQQQIRQMNPQPGAR